MKRYTSAGIVQVSHEFHASKPLGAQLSTSDRLKAVVRSIGHVKHQQLALQYSKTLTREALDKVEHRQTKHYNHLIGLESPKLRKLDVRVPHCGSQLTPKFDNLDITCLQTHLQPLTCLQVTNMKHSATTPVAYDVLLPLESRSSPSLHRACCAQTVRPHTTDRYV
jgi:hypothetical protein